MILREMPRVRDPAYAREFYQWWGTRNCVILARATRAEYSRLQQTFSVKMAYGGSEDYFIDQRRVTVDDDSFLVLNEGRAYGSAIVSRAPVESFTLFFRPGLLQETHAALRVSGERWLDDSSSQSVPVELSEHLRPLDLAVVPVLRFIRLGVLRGATGEEWLEDQFSLVAVRLLGAHAIQSCQASGLEAMRAATRAEVLRRLRLGADYLQSNYSRDVRIADAAVAAAMSRYHFTRLFRDAFDCTPQAFLRCKRIKVAQRLLRSTSATVDDVAGRVGLMTRSALFRAMRAVDGTTPRAWRRVASESN